MYNYIYKQSKFRLATITIHETIQYESKGDKGKNLPIKKYLNMIKPYLSDIINDHKIRGLVRYHSGNKS